MDGEAGYLELLRRVLEYGENRQDRTGVGTRAVFFEQLRFDLREGYPLLTTKTVSWRSVATELLWFLKGDQDLAFLHEHGVRFWDANAGPRGEVGPMYGAQWRAWGGRGGPHDQLAEAIRLLREEPTSRRILVSAWNVADLPYMALPPCHYAYQFYVDRGTYLDCAVTMRSADLFLGLPFNIASYALLTQLVAQVTGLEPGRLLFNLGDAHLYRNHFEQADLQLTREPFPPPQLWVSPSVTDIDDFSHEDLQLGAYRHHPAIPAPMAV